MATSSFNINDFTSRMLTGGALLSLFQCTISATGKGAKGKISDFQFMCKSVGFPASTIDVTAVTYMGRAVNVPGNRAVAQVTTSIYNDEFMEIRNYIESWMERLNSQKTNVRDAAFIKILDYTGEMKIRQLKKDGSGKSKEYVFHNVWPSTCPEIPMSWETNEIQKFDVVWEYNYWSSTESGAGA